MLVREAHRPVPDVVGAVEVAQGSVRDLDAHVQFELQTALLQAESGPALEHSPVEQVPADIAHDLQPAIVSAVKSPPVHQLAAVEHIPPQCRVGCLRGAVKLLANLPICPPEIVEELIYAPCLIGGHLFAAG